MHGTIHTRSLTPSQSCLLAKRLSIEPAIRAPGYDSPAEQGLSHITITDFTSPIGKRYGVSAIYVIAGG